MLNRGNAILLAVLGAAAASAGIAWAQGGTIDIPPGTKVKNGRSEIMAITRCGQGELYRMCWFNVYRDGVLMGGGERYMSAEVMLRHINGVRDEEGLPPLNADQVSGRAPYPEKAAAAPRPNPAPVGARPSIPATTPIRTNPVAAKPPSTGGQCPRTPYVTVPGSRPASTALFKQVMESGHTFSRPAYLWTGVTFEAFSVGAPVRNKITMRPGVGPERVTDAAPVDTALYPVRATYVLCHQYRSGPERMHIQTGNYCFVGHNRNWVCGTDSDVAKYVARPIG